MGGWALAPSSGAEDSQIFRVIDPATGQLRFDVATPAAYYTSSVARSAHGRLLALGAAWQVLQNPECRLQMSDSSVF
jgi:hypothetical protein